MQLKFEKLDSMVAENFDIYSELGGTQVIRWLIRRFQRQYDNF